MKVFISADIEGVTGSTLWSECDCDSKHYALFAELMTQEVAAACRGAFKAGATEIVVKDSHATGTNIDITKLPEGVKLIRSWSGHPFSMVDGIDETFDAAMFVGYHSAANRGGNPLSHTMSSSTIAQMTINGKIASEFTLYSYAAALVGVPSVFLSGDAMLCEDVKDMHPKLKTVAVKDGRGGITINESPAVTQRWIEAGAEEALRCDLKSALVTLPEHFEVTLRYKEHRTAHRRSYYPGMTEVDATTLRFESDDFFEVLRMVAFVIG